MTSERIRIVSEGYEGWNRRDFDAMVSLLAPDVEWRTAGVFPGLKPVYHGHDGVGRFWQSMQEAWEIIEINPHRFVEHDDKVLAEFHFHAKGRGSGAEVKMEWIHVFTFGDDLVVVVAGYRTIEEALAAEGIPAAAMRGASRMAP
ncbi:MAG: nuclear transport factor 2 family protein [Solirubrobacterales bacterium]